MAAALQCAARRLGGAALQGTWVALKDGQRRVFPRLVNTKTLTADEKKDALSLVEEIKMKKEELYSLIAKCEQKYTVGGTTGLQNSELLAYLSHQVKPKPNDPQWLSCYRATRINNYMRTAGSIGLGYATVSTTVYCCVEGVKKGKEDVPSQ